MTGLSGQRDCLVYRDSVAGLSGHSVTGVPGTLHTRGQLLKRFENCIHVACVFEVSLQTSRTRGLFMSHCIFFFNNSTGYLFRMLKRSTSRANVFSTDSKQTIQYNITLLPSVNTLIARGMFCGAKYTHHTFTPIIKHLIIKTANKHPGKRSFIDKSMRKSHWHQAVHIT